MITITRKVQLNVVNADKNATWKKLYDYNNIVRTAANLISTHQFCLDNLQQFLYLKNDIKYEIANVEKDESGILITSRQNTTYQLCSSLFKGQIPMDILGSLNQAIYKTYNKEKKDYAFGNKSLRNYKSSIPIPFPKKAIKYFEYDKDKKNYRINLYDFEFITYLGIDKSNNKTIIDRCLSGEYKLCDSSIQIAKDKKTKKTKYFFF